MARKKMSNEKDSWALDEKIYLREDGIIYIDIAEALSGEGSIEFVEGFLKKSKDMVKSLSGNKKLLVKNTPSLGASVTASEYRNRLIEIVKEIFRKIDFNKVAIFGGDVTSRVIASFIITASGLDNFKVFKTEEEALKWLKE